MVKVRTCECCGHPLPDDGVVASLTAMQRKLYLAVKQAGRAGVNIHILMDRVYADDPDGGVESYNILHVVRSKMAPRLAKHGLKIITSSRGPGALWTLEKI